MQVIKIKDTHPGKWQDGMELFLVEVNSDRHGHFITGFRVNTSDNRGMFSDREEPIQVINGDLFTMSNLGSITRDEINTLLQNGILIRDEVFRPNGMTLKILE